MDVGHSVVDLVLASLIEESAVAGSVDGSVAHSAGGSELVGSDSAPPNIHHLLEDQKVDSDRPRAKVFSPARLLVFLLRSTQYLALGLGRRGSFGSAPVF